MKRKEQKRAEIIEAGAKIFHMKGYNGTGIKEISDSCNMLKGSFYNYFESKEHFAVEVLKDYRQKFVTQLQENLSDGSKSPLERIKNLFLGYISYYEEELQCSLGCFASSMGQEMSDINDTIRESTESLMNSGNTLLAQCLKESRDLGETHFEMSAEDMSYYVWNSYRGAILSMKVSKSIEPLKLFYKFLTEVTLR